MADFNAVMVMGRLVRDPELKYSQNGLPVCNMRLAANRKYRKADGTPGESTLFVDVNAWRRLAELCSQYLKKGREVFVAGQLVQSQWTDKNGQKQSRIRITANSVEFIGAPKETAEAVAGSGVDSVDRDEEAE